MVTNKDGNLPLHLAVLRDDLTMVELLLAADRKQEDTQREMRSQGGYTRKPPEGTKSPTMETLLGANNEGDLPLHLALASPHKFNMWILLLEPDEAKETLQVSNDVGVTPFQFFVDQPHLFRHDGDFVDAHLAEAILNHLLSGRRLEPWDDHLKRSVANSHKMQLMMNRKSANRIPVVLFVADFYAHVLSVIAVYYTTDSALKYPHATFELNSLAPMLFVLIAYFLCREFIQLLLSKSLYWSDFWNYADLVRIALLIMLAMIVEGEFLDLDNIDHMFFGRRLMLALAVMVYSGVISFLRMTYLPFALFVGGSSQIVVTLIPFMVTFLLAMALFAYGYWVGGFVSAESGQVQSYAMWLLEVFIIALADPVGLITMEDAYINKVWWTVLYALLIQVLLLNVLIAVITSAWEEITDCQTEVFLGYRLEYSAGVLPIEYFLRKNLQGTWLLRTFDKTAKLHDSLDKMKISDTVNWDVYPYSKVVEDPSLYWDNQRWAALLSNEMDHTSRFAMSEVLKVRGGGLDPRKSYRGHPAGKAEQSDLENPRSFQADYKFSTSTCQRIYARLRLLGYLLFWFYAFVAGFITFGFTWPRRVRAFFCAPSTTTSGKNDRDNTLSKAPSSTGAASVHSDPFASSIDPNSAKKQEHHEALEKKIDDMKETIEALQKTVETLVVNLLPTTGSE